MRSVFLAIFLIQSLLFGAQGPKELPSKQITSESKPTPSASSDSRILGAFEVRPSYRSNLGEFHSEDSALLGYQFNRNDSAVYKQEFNTNIFDPKLPVSQSGVNATLVDGYFRERSNNFYTKGKFSLSFESRQYLPTWETKRDAGMITALRNYAKLRYQATSGLAFTFDEVPVIHLYNQAGSVTRRGPLANPDFENRASVGFEYVFSDQVKLVMPILVSTVHTRSYSDKAANNNRWLNKIWLNPEVYYAVSSNLQVGLGYYSENLFRSDMAETTLHDAFQQGTTQLIFSTSL